MQPAAAAMDAFTCLTRRPPPFWRKRAYWAENSFSPSKRTSPGRSCAGRTSYRSPIWLTERGGGDAQSGAFLESRSYAGNRSLTVAALIGAVSSRPTRREQLVALNAAAG